MSNDDDQAPARKYSLEELHQSIDRVFMRQYGTTRPGEHASIFKSDPTRNGNSKGQRDQFEAIQKILKSD